jgi:hypothetical protein
MHSASCLCGAVTWGIDGPLELMSHCHCSRCRKTHGAPFATYVAAAASDLRLDGASQVVKWESSPGFFRCFCRRCGSVVPGGPVDDRVYVPAGNFTGDPDVRPLAHIFVADKAPWHEISDALPAFDSYPEGFDVPVLPTRPPLDPPGAPRGSCLCGGVSFVMSGPPLRCWNCHCGRCRKARSAAHASNLFSTAEGLRFTRGEDLLDSFKVPDAQRFTQIFCRVCGSIMPRADRDRGISIIPMGALDDHPGMAPQAHIFVGSKAPWYEITDALPQHQESPPTT